MSSGGVALQAAPELQLLYLPSTGLGTATNVERQKDWKKRKC